MTGNSKVNIHTLFLKLLLPICGVNSHSSTCRAAAVAPPLRMLITRSHGHAPGAWKAASAGVRTHHERGCTWTCCSQFLFIFLHRLRKAIVISQSTARKNILLAEGRPAYVSIKPKPPRARNLSTRLVSEGPPGNARADLQRLRPPPLKALAS